MNPHRRPHRRTLVLSHLLLVALVAAGALAGCNAPAAPAEPPGGVAAAALADSAAPGSSPVSPLIYPAGAPVGGSGFVVTEVKRAPQPPLAPAGIGALIADEELAGRTEAADTEDTDTAATDTEAADAPPLIAAADGPPFDWSTSENYLVLGTDRRQEGGSWRTDSIMLIGIDRAQARAAVFSIPRDLYVSIPGYGYGRINQADYMGERRAAGGGPALVSAILEETLGVSTDHWVRIQMDGFVRFVDDLGGVDIYLDCPFSEPIFNLDTQQWQSFTLPAGINHLDGEDAYWFARLRYRESDIGRSSRQRAIIWALREKILSSNAILRLPELYQTFNETIATDLSLFDIIGLAQFAVSLEPANVRASGLTLRDLANYTTPGGAQVLVLSNRARARELLANVWAAPAMADAYRKDAADCPDVAAARIPDETLDLLLMGGVVSTETTTLEGSLAPTLPVAGAPVTPPAFDPLTGWPIDPVTGFPIDPASGYAIDPATGAPLEWRGVILLDPETGLPVDE